MIEQIITIGKFGKALLDVHDAYKTISTIVRGDKNQKLLEELVAQARHTNRGIERLSDHILYAPNLDTITDASQTRQRYVENLRDVRASLEPVQKVLGTDILSTAMILTPQTMQNEISKDFENVFFDVAPIHEFSSRIPEDGVPVLFSQNGMVHLGWQKRGALAAMGCIYHDLDNDSLIITSPSSVRKPHSYLVGPGGKYSSINEALRIAPSGATIRVKAGTYKESLLLSKPVEIVGHGKVRIRSDNDYCVSISTDNASIRGLSLTCIGEENTAVEISQGKLVLEDCDISASDVGVAIGQSAHGILRNCRIHDNEWGVVVYEGGKGEIESCEITANKLSGLAISSSGDPRVRNCHIHDNGSGVDVSEGGKGEVESCEITANKTIGIAISSSGDPRVRNCRIHDHEGGVIVDEDGKGEVEDCEITANKLSGLAISSSGEPRVRNCRIHDNGVGVIVDKGGKGKLENCEIFKNSRQDVFISPNENTVLHNCRINDRLHQ